MSSPDNPPATIGSHQRAPSQTLDRGLHILEVVATATRPMTIADVCQAVGLHRSIAYRMLRTLTVRGLLRKDKAGGYTAGASLVVLARNVVPALRAAASRPLAALAEDLGMTAFLVIRQGDECVTIAVHEPPTSVAHVAYRPGTRHPVDRGAPGQALLAGEAAVPGERPEIAAARRAGFASSEAEVLPGMRSVATPVTDDAGLCYGAVAVVFVGRDDLGVLGKRVGQAASEVARRLG